MMVLSFGQIAYWCNGEIVHGEQDAKVSGISTDTRTIKPNELFVALKGDRFDGHQFVSPELMSRCASMIVSRKWYSVNNESVTLPTIIVDDTLTALQLIARHYRQMFNISCVAITGSNGKTTTKDITAHLLSKKFKIVSTSGNLNNHIGVPLTIFKLNPSTEVLVTELGMNHPGEISELAKMAKPQCGVITNVAPVHLEFLKTIENVYMAKLELAPQVTNLIINGDDPELINRAKLIHRQITTFGLSANCNIKGRLRESDDGAINRFSVGRRNFQLSLPGRHNVRNALAAIAVARAFKLNWNLIAEGLATVAISKNRSELIQTKRFSLFNDCYNANPVSMHEALQMLKDHQTSSYRIAVLGDMYELGEKASDYHFQLGQVVADLGIDKLVAYGDFAEEMEKGAKQSGLNPDNVRVCRSLDQVYDYLQEVINQGDVILVKGSRAMQMEKIVDGLKEAK